MRSLVRFQLAPRMRALRRFVMTLGLAGVFAAVVWARGSGGVAPQKGGWREVLPPEPPTPTDS